jgi:hypothetical protein
MPLQDESYECLEFEGDSVLGVCVATYLRKKYPERKQGFLTDARKALDRLEQTALIRPVVVPTAVPRATEAPAPKASQDPL